MPVIHTYHSAQAETSNGNLVGSTEWNNNHVITLALVAMSANGSISIGTEYVELTGSPTVVLPDATATGVDGSVMYLINVGTGAPIVDGYLTQLINGDQTYILTDQWQYIKIRANAAAAGWRIIGGN
jgi:hypothetical protein